MDKPKILLIGCGKMGGSLLEGIAKSDNNFNLIDVVDPAITGSYKKKFKKNRTNFYSDIRGLKDRINYDSIIVATKPSNYIEIFDDLKNQRIVNGETLVISILAGVKIKKIEDVIGSIAIIRAMPNIASSVAEGMTALVGNKKINNDQISAVNIIFQSIGNKIWLEDEDQMDSFTAIAGSGPAYFFYFTECLQKIAIAEGFSENIAKQISEQIIIGSGKLIKNTNIDVVQLRENVTSPNGTTEAALKVLIDNNSFFNKLSEAIDMAKKRSIEIANN